MSPHIFSHTPGPFSKAPYLARLHKDTQTHIHIYIYMYIHICLFIHSHAPGPFSKAPYLARLVCHASAHHSHTWRCDVTLWGRSCAQSPISLFIMI